MLNKKRKTFNKNVKDIYNEYLEFNYANLKQLRGYRPVKLKESARNMSSYRHMCTKMLELMLPKNITFEIVEKECAGNEVNYINVILSTIKYNGQVAYMYTVNDVLTNEILSYVVTEETGDVLLIEAIYKFVDNFYDKKHIGKVIYNGREAYRKTNQGIGCDNTEVKKMIGKQAYECITFADVRCLVDKCMRKVKKKR